MAKNKKVASPVTDSTEAPKRRGRPRAFQEETKAFGVHLPVSTISRIREMAETRGELHNQLIARLVDAAFNKATARRTKQGAESAPATEATA